MKTNRTERLQQDVDDVLTVIDYDFDEARRHEETQNAYNRVRPLIAQAPALMDFARWVTSCVPVNLPHGIKVYAISDEQMDKARALLAHIEEG